MKVPASELVVNAAVVTPLVVLSGALPRTVHPLLVYTELLTSGDERAREAGVELRERFLRELE